MNITPQDAMDEYKRYENTMKQLNAARTPKSKMHSSRGTGYVMAVQQLEQARKNMIKNEQDLLHNEILTGMPME